MAAAHDDEDDSGAGDWDDDWGDYEERPRNRLAEVLTVFGIAFPFALLFAAALAVLGIGLVIAVVYAMMWFLFTALGSGHDG